MSRSVLSYTDLDDIAKITFGKVPQDLRGLTETLVLRYACGERGSPTEEKYLTKLKLISRTRKLLTERGRAFLFAAYGPGHATVMAKISDRLKDLRARLEKNSTESQYKDNIQYWSGAVRGVRDALEEIRTIREES